MKQKKTICISWVLITVFLGIGPALAEESTRQSVTVIRPGADGETQVITVDRITRDTIQQTETTVRQPREEPPDGEIRKARIMVLPATFAQERRRRLDRVLNDVFGIADPGVIESPGFTSYMIDALVNTRKFDMLERTTLDSLVQEMQFGETEFADPNKVRTIGNMMGADYAVIPEIRYLELDRRVVQVPYIGGEQVTLECKLATNMRTVDVATGRIISSSVDEVSRMVRPRQNTTVRIAVQDLFAEAFKEIAMREAANIADVAYPIRIMSISGDMVMLNRGRGALIEGEELRVYATGEMLVDPDTRENLGYHEAYVGRVIVSEIGQRTSKATIIEQAGPFERLYVARRIQAPSRQTQPRMQPAPRID